MVHNIVDFTGSFLLGFHLFDFLLQSPILLFPFPSLLLQSATKKKPK